jgi:tRNA threonylcarbamoyladenosine modification (KEOPS) complex  Pcc1 subunit
MKKLYSSLSEIRTQTFTGKFTLVLFLLLSAIGQASAQDNTANPLDISNLSHTPTVIDTSNGSQAVSVTIRVTDVVSDVTSVSVRFRSMTGNQFVSVNMNSQNRISGDSRDGLYQKEAVFPQYSKSGNWQIYEISAYDSSNYRNFSNSDLADRRFPTELQVISINEDVTSPEIVEFSFTPSFVDMNNDSQNVTVTVRAKDIQSGVHSLDVSFYRAGQDYLYGVSMKRISGDSKDGIYKGVLTFSQHPPSGTYGVFISASDTIGNSKHINTEDLAKLGFPAELQIGVAATSSAPPQKSRKRARSF